MNTKIGIAKAFANTKWPTIVMNGSSNGITNAMDAIALRQMIDLVNQVSK